MSVAGLKVLRDNGLAGVWVSCREYEEELARWSWVDGGCNKKGRTSGWATTTSCRGSRSVRAEQGRSSQSVMMMMYVTIVKWTFVAPSKGQARHQTSFPRRRISLPLGRSLGGPSQAPNCAYSSRAERVFTF